MLYRSNTPTPGKWNIGPSIPEFQRETYSLLEAIDDFLRRYTLHKAETQLNNNDDKGKNRKESQKEKKN